MMKYRDLGRTGIQISAVTYGGIVSAGEYDRKPPTITIAGRSTAE